MAIKKDTDKVIEKKNGMNIVDNMDGEERANNKLNSMMVKLNRKEKNDLAILKTKEENSDTFGPLTTKEKERLNELLIKEKED